MSKKNILLSIIIVHYKVEKELFVCIDSTIKSKPKVNYEIIVVDNDEKKTIEKNLKSNFAKVRYVKSPRNLGFGAGNNLGSRYAKGDFLFFLNPDTEVFAGTIDVLVNFLKKNSSAAIVAPIFLDKNHNVYPLQGSKKLTPLRAIFTLSFLYRLLPNNAIAKEYLLSDWDKTEIKEVDVVPGTGFMIRKTIFDEAIGFDENFFLYFEEFDLCNRVKKLGYKIYILPKAKVKHLWEVSTKRANFDIKKVFQKSRFYYFKKYYGLIPAFAVELLARLSKTHILMGAILAWGTFLRIYKLQELMPFIGDQGWFYLSAQNMILTGHIPLVGITSSHIWLHQGALWTYMLSFALWLFNFNPISGAYLTGVLGVIAVWLIYKIGSEMFSKNIGLIAAFLYATSPLVVVNDRMPYHTSPIPFFTLLFIYSLYKWTKGNSYFFPLVIFFLAILYNLELATSLFLFILLPILSFGLWRKKEWALKILNKKILFLTLIAFIIPMLPILIYDIQNGFPQTVRFIIWIGYKVIVFFGYPTLHPEIPSANLESIILFLAYYYQRLIFLANGLVAFTVFYLSFGFFSIKTFLLIKQKKYEASFIILILLVSVSFLGFFTTKTISEAYLPIFFPTIIFVTALFFDNLMQIKRLFIPTILVLFSITLINSYFLISKDYLMGKGYGLSFTQRLSIAKQIIKESNCKSYNLIGKGEGAGFESFTMNYEYLTWWLGHGPSKSPENLKFIIEEKIGGILLTTH